MKKESLSPGFTLIEVILVIILIAMIASMGVPFSMSLIEKHQEKKLVIEVAVEISRMRDATFANLTEGEIFLDEGQLVFTLAGKEIKRFKFDQKVELENKIVFNQNGVCNGGVIVVHQSRAYKMIVEKIRGNVTLERI